MQNHLNVTCIFLQTSSLDDIIEVVNFMSIGRKFSQLSSASFVVLRIPYEYNPSFGHGCKDGPAAIVNASKYVELFDDEMRIKPHTAGIATEAIVGFSSKHEDSLALIGDSFLDYYKKGKFVISLGGEHSITIGIINKLATVASDFSVIQFDAHLDFRNYYAGSTLNHACVMRRAFDVTASTFSIGIRSFSESEYKFSKTHNTPFILARDMVGMPLSVVIDRVINNTKKDVYITFDVDCFDYSVIQNTGTPEPGGLGWFRTLSILRALFEHKNVLSMDVVELVGGVGTENSAFSAALLVKKCMAYKIAANSVQ